VAPYFIIYIGLNIGQYIEQIKVFSPIEDYASLIRWPLWIDSK